jgi:hypothetical protein
MIFEPNLSVAASATAWIPLLYGTIVLLLTMYRVVPPIRHKEAGHIVQTIFKVRKFGLLVIPRHNSRYCISQDGLLYYGYVHYFRSTALCFFTNVPRIYKHYLLCNAGPHRVGRCRRPWNKEPDCTVLIKCLTVHLSSSADLKYYYL